MRTLSLAGLMRAVSAWIPTSEGDRRSCATRFAGLNKQLRDGKKEADRCASCASEKRKSVKRRGFSALEGGTYPKGRNERGRRSVSSRAYEGDTEWFLDQTGGIVTPRRAHPTLVVGRSWQLTSL